MGYNSRHADYENVKAKRNQYPYNLLLSTFSGVCGEAQANNLEIMMKILSKRDIKAAITMEKFKGSSIDNIKSKFKCRRKDVFDSIDETKRTIVKYKDSLFNGFNNSKLCIKLRKDFKDIGVQDNIIIDLNTAKIYDINCLVDMNSEEFIKTLSDCLSTARCAEIISVIIPILNKAGYDISKITSHAYTHEYPIYPTPNNGPKLTVSRSEVSIYSEENNNMDIEDDSNVAKIYKIDPIVEVYFVCPICGKHPSIKFHIKSTGNNIYFENFNNKEYECPSCGYKIKLRKNNSLF